MAGGYEEMAAIRQVMARYCRGIDRLDRELVSGAFWADAYDDHGPFQGTGPEFVDWIMPAMEQMHAVSSHILGQSYFEFAGERAAVETPFTAHRIGHGERAGIRSTLGGRYVDIFERRDGEWRILRRIVMYDWSAKSEAEPLDFAHLEGSRSREDPSYQTFALLREPTE